MFALVLAVFIDGAALWFRPARLELTLPKHQERVWLFVGLDDRSALPEGPDTFGRSEDTGARADVLLVARQTNVGLSVISVPRDLIFPVPQGTVWLGTSWWESPQLTIDTLCSGLGIPVTDVVALNMRGFATLIDALGGITVELAAPIRDAYAHLELAAGTHHLDGEAALALVRARHAETLVDGQWVSDGEGALGRQRRSAEVLSLVAAKAADASWLELHRAAWRVLPDVSLSANTSPLDMAELRGKRLDLTLLSGESTGDSELLQPNDETFATLAANGLTGCDAN